MTEPFIYKFSVNALTDEGQEQKLRNLLQSIAGIERIDVNRERKLLRIISSQAIDLGQLMDKLTPHGFHLQVIPMGQTLTSSRSSVNTSLGEEKIMNVGIDGMTCRSCEITVERAWKKLDNVRRVSVNAALGSATLTIERSAPTVADLQQALGSGKYQVHSNVKRNGLGNVAVLKRPTFGRLVGLFALVFILGKIFSALGLLKTSFAVGAATSFGAIFLVGLVAASSSCIAVTGGLLLSAAVKFNERYPAAGRIARLRPVALFIAGRILGYTALGGLLGVVGSVLTPSPLVTALITIAAAVFMLIMGLDILGLAPGWLKAFLPRLPKSIAHRIMDAERHDHPLASFGLGAATFFLPCGFTQALQLYALTTGSFATGAMTMFAFAIGTAPALIALGLTSSSLKGKAGAFFLQFSGALVVVLGLSNIQNGLTIAGYPIVFPSFGSMPTIASSGSDNNQIVMDGDTQVIAMRIGYAGYEPSHFTVRAGVPVRWEIDGDNATGCTSVLVSRELGIQELLKPGKNIIAFIPEKVGEVQFSCSMGMVRGSLTVLPQA